MRAAEYDRTGPAAEVLRLVERPVPDPAPGEVRVRVMASAVNPTDTKSRAGRSVAGGMAFPAVTPHMDGAGVIDAVGEGVDAGRIGERVWVWFAQAGRPRGTAAEWCTVPADRAVPLPEGTTWEEGACLGIPAMTAHYALLGDGPIGGRTVLVQGGAGAVGFYAVQIARHAGARVLATVSRPEQAALAGEAGAHAVLYRHDGDLATAIRAEAPEGVHRIVEVALGSNLPLDLAVLARGGTVAFYASDAEPRPVLDARALMRLDARLHGILLYEAPDSALAAAVEGIGALLAAGRLRHSIGLRLPLSRIVEAHEAMEGGRVLGKIVLDPSA
jgi:NADPH2:quinone reductase